MSYQLELAFCDPISHMIAMRGESAKIENSLLLICFSFCDPMFALQMQSAGKAHRTAFAKSPLLGLSETKNLGILKG